jgi:hypothetical protein
VIPGQADTPTLQMNEEQNVIRHQATPGEDLDGEEIDASQHGHMRLNKLLPRRGLAPFRRRSNALALQNIPYGLIRDGVTEVGQRAHDAVVTPLEFSLAICTINASSFGSIRGLPG